MNEPSTLEFVESVRILLELLKDPALYLSGKEQFTYKMDLRDAIHVVEQHLEDIR